MIDGKDIPLDPVSMVAAAIAGLVVGDAGLQVATYIVVLGSSTLGALWAVQRRPLDMAMPWPLFSALLIGSVSLCGVGVTLIIERTTNLPFLWLLAPVCTIMAGIGHDWPKIGQILLEKSGSLLDTLLRRKTGGNE